MRFNKGMYTRKHAKNMRFFKGRDTWFDWEEHYLRLAEYVAEMDTKTRVTQLFRLVSSILIITCVIVLLNGSVSAPDSMYLMKLDTSRVDVATGLYSVLRDGVSSSNILSDKLGAGVTAAEITILAEYAEDQVEDAPQYITSSLYNWCSVSYGSNYDFSFDSSYDGNRNYGGEIFHSNSSNSKTNYTEKCSSPTSSYFFDYRSLLSQSKLEIILNYAYGDTGDNSAYFNYIDRREMLFHAVPKLLIAIASENAVLLLLMLLRRIHIHNKIPIAKILSQSSAALSLIVFIQCSVASIGITVLCIQLRSSIKSELSAYGLNLHLGTTWFALLWTCFCATFFSMLAWAGPVWCATPDTIELDDNEEDDESRLAMYVNRGSHDNELQDSSHKRAIEFKPFKKSMNTLLKKSSTLELTKILKNDDSSDHMETSTYLTSEESDLLKSNDILFHDNEFRY